MIMSQGENMMHHWVLTCIRNAHVIDAADVGRVLCYGIYTVYNTDTSCQNLKNSSILEYSDIEEYARE